MNLGAIQSFAVKSFSRGALLVQKYSPEILTAAGIASGATAAVLASKATLELEPIIDQMHTGVKHAQNNKEFGKDYSDKKYGQDLAYVYTRAGLRVAKLYAVPVGVGVVSVTCILSAHGILKNRNVALAAAYTAIEKSYSQYRKRVVEELGADKDEEFRYGLSKVTVHDTAKGTVEEALAVSEDTDLSGYAAFFDESNVNWSGHRDVNLHYIRAQQQFANDKLHAKGHVFLNDVYRALGLPDTSAGAVVGWVLNKEQGGTGDGDGFIDFGLFYGTHPAKQRDIVNGFDGAILLDFNVDGLIWDKIGKGRKV